MTAVKKRFLILTLLLATVGLDRITKVIARDRLESAPPISLFGGIVRLDYVENPGAFLGLGSGLSETTRFWIFSVLVGGFLVGLFLYVLIYRRLSVIEVAAFSLILGGGLGNLIDRVLYDYVIDFLVVGIGRLRTGVFNVADLAITAGVGLLFLRQVRSARRQELQSRS
ncbi:signal peptidase II [Candidatus Manganitrophus noduliformans]|uniref:Lipoprotein signal peptidase n=1 Tax=Candidatus Manganitrophus noduliformans TaxID=2606439 RepID=A0A7X6DRF5_9BACT|nr:signal peptidase II [Candidatus Manganitrophus noduliformans]NKE71794.1 signal peptidase II [Candidatus Manganitrophus noduliformans]